MRSTLPALLLAALLAGCSWFEPAPQVRGNKVDPDALTNLVPGTSTQADVTSLLGSPTAKASFDDSTWIYISEVTQPRVGQVQGITSQQVVTMKFDGRGVLRDVKRLGSNDAQPVAVVARATPSPGSEASFLQQLLGNVGRFNAGPGGSATSKEGQSGASFGSK